MTKIRNSILARLWGILLLAAILNLSIDSPDFYAEHVAEDLSYNEIESIFEYVIEGCLEFGNVIPESDDNDDDSKFKFKKVDVLNFSSNLSIRNMDISALFVENSPNYKQKLYQQETIKPQSPPPWKVV